MTDLLKRVKREAAEAGRASTRADCAVRALAVATGAHYAEVEAALEAAGRRRGAGTYLHEIEAGAGKLGYTLKPLDKRHDVAKAKTVVSLERALPKRGVFLVLVAGHILCARAGKVHDHVTGSRRRVKRVWRVVRNKGVFVVPDYWRKAMAERKRLKAAKRRRETRRLTIETYYVRYIDRHGDAVCTTEYDDGKMALREYRHAMLTTDEVAVVLERRRVYANGDDYDLVLERHGDGAALEAGGWLN